MSICFFSSLMLVHNNIPEKVRAEIKKCASNRFVSRLLFCLASALVFASLIYQYKSSCYCFTRSKVLARWPAALIRPHAVYYWLCSDFTTSYKLSPWLTLHWLYDYFAWCRESWLLLPTSLPPSPSPSVSFTSSCECRLKKHIRFHSHDH
jgi:hypothetical protein